MSKRRILGIGVLVSVATIVLVAAVALWQLMGFGADIRRFFDEGLLGPDDQRQRVVTAHGLAISMAEGWIAEEPPPDPDAELRLGMRALLTMRPPEEDTVCSVHLAAGAAAIVSGSDDGWHDDDEVERDYFERLFVPWLVEHGIHVDEWISTGAGPWSGAHRGLAVDAAGFTGAAWVVPHAEDLYMLACSLVPADADEPGPDSSGSTDLLLAMGPMAASLEFLPEQDASPAAS